MRPRKELGRFVRAVISPDRDTINSQTPLSSFPFWGFLVFLMYSMRRVDCRRCEAVVVEEVPWATANARLTRAYMLFLARWARNCHGRKRPKPFALHGKRFSMPSNMSSPSGWSSVFSAQIDAIGVDEIQYAKGHKYLTLVYQIDLGVTRLLWVGKEKNNQIVSGIFTMIGDGRFEDCLRLFRYVEAVSDGHSRKVLSRRCISSIASTS